MSNKMNPEIKQKWVEALRSGKYNQTEVSLKDCQGHCCLGVLCEIRCKELGVNSDTFFSEVLEDTGGQGFLNKSMLTWAEFDETVIFEQHETAFSINPKGIKMSLHELNDNGYTFNYIADIIEKHL